MGKWGGEEGDRLKAELQTRGRFPVCSSAFRRSPSLPAPFPPHEFFTTFLRASDHCVRAMPFNRSRWQRKETVL